LPRLWGGTLRALAASTITRLKALWWDEYEAWRKRDLSAKAYVYFWADGVYFSPRMDHDKQCVLVIIGAAMNGQRPVINLHRVEFALLAMEQIVNNSAKSHYVSNGQHKVPIVIRMVVGRGWGQGPEHSQSLEPIFAQFPGLKVVMPTLAEDAKGMLIAAIEDDNPVMFIEHRVIDKHFDFVGMDEYFSQSLFAICALSGLDKAPIWRDEPRVAPPSTEDLDPELITRIRDLVRIDLAVYERQRELFEKTYAGFLAEFNRTVGSLCINHMARCAG